jgi:hypothetical protein
VTASRALGAHGGGAEEGFLRHGGRGLLLTFYAALRSLKLYPLENATVQKALDDLLAATQHLLAEEDEVDVQLSGDFIFVNETRLRLELDNYASFSQVLAILRAFDIGIPSGRVERRTVFLSSAQPGHARRPGDRYGEPSGSPGGRQHLEPSRRNRSRG